MMIDDKRRNADDNGSRISVNIDSYCGGEFPRLLFAQSDWYDGFGNRL